MRNADRYTRRFVGSVCASTANKKIVAVPLAYNGSVDLASTIYSQSKVKVVHEIVTLYWYKFFSLAVRKHDRCFEKFIPVDTSHFLNGLAISLIQYMLNSMKQTCRAANVILACCVQAYCVQAGRKFSANEANDKEGMSLERKQVGVIGG